MKLDIATLALVLSLVLSTQVIALFFQHRQNRADRGIQCWLLGASLMALGFAFMPLLRIKALLALAMIANPLVVLGHIFLYFGVVEFFGEEGKRWPWASGFALFLASYYFYIFFDNQITGRTVVVSVAVATVSLLTCHRLLLKRESRIASSARFTAMAFLLYGALFALRTCLTMILPPIRTYTDAPAHVSLAYAILIVTSTLWTFGFILMTNQRLNAEMLGEKENLQRVFNTGPDPALITRLEDGMFVDVNLGFLTVTGFSRAELIGSSTIGRDIWQDLSNRERFVAELKARGSCEDMGFVLRRKNGSRFDGVLSAKTITINGSAHIVSVVRDITGRKKLESERAELAARNWQLQKAESLGRMAGAIAHHFNNQLQAVLGNLEMVAMLPRSQDPVLHLARATQAAERAAEVSRLMLVYLGQASGDQEPRLLSVLCRASLSSLRTTLPAGVSLDLDSPAPGPVVSANAAQIQQALANLVINAREALGEAPGHIRLRLRTGPGAEIPTVHRFPIDWQPQGAEYASLEVSDSGGGIAEADIEKLFDPFFSTKFTGRGLGLCVVLGCVQAHGGAVSVASGPGPGSVFRLHLPVCTVPEPVASGV